MRYVSVENLKSGMIIGNNLIGRNGELLLPQGTILNDAYILKLQRIEYNGIYVKEENTEDLDIHFVVKDVLKNQMVKNIRNLFTGAKNGEIDKNQKSISANGLIIKEILNDLINNKTVMIKMVDLKMTGDHLFFHSVNVSVIALVLGIAYGLNKNELYELGVASLLHDIGKMFIDPKILDKPGKLTDEEFDVMKTHSTISYQVLRDNPDMNGHILQGILQHHEKFDGTGYPNSLKENKIHKYGQIIGIADVYDALISDRIYRKAMLPSDALEIIMAGSGKHFNPGIVVIFLKKIALYPIGVTVQLNNGAIGIVYENFESLGGRPRLKIIEENGNSIVPYFLDLANDPQTLNLIVVKVVEI